VRLAGRSVLVTGATGGLGRAIAHGLAARGARLVLSGQRRDQLELLAAQLGGRAVAADLADPASVEALIAAAGEVDVLVANAAVPASGRVEAKTAEDVDRALAVNLRAPIVLAQALVPGMAARGGGHLVFVSSLAGKAGAPGMALYAATKFGLRGFALSLREDLHPAGIGVSGVFPGFIRDAGMFADSGATLPPFVGTRTPGQVAAAVVRAIERDRAEVDVAPLGLRVGAALAGLAPGTTARLQRRLGGAAVAEQIARGQAGG